MSIVVKGNYFEVMILIKRPANTTAYSAGKLFNSGFAINSAITDTSKTVTPSDMNGIVVGMTVTGTGIAANSTVVTVGATTIMLNNAATATNATAALTFAPVGLPKLDLSAFAQPWQIFEINEAVIKSNNGGVTTMMNPQLLLYNDPLPQATIVDATAFAPTFAACLAKAEACIDSFDVVVKKGATAIECRAEEKCRRGKLSSAACTYVALLDNSAYVPASGELIAIMIKGILH